MVKKSETSEAAQRSHMLNSTRKHKVSLVLFRLQLPEATFKQAKSVRSHSKDSENGPKNRTAKRSHFWDRFCAVVKKRKKI